MCADKRLCYLKDIEEVKVVEGLTNQKVSEKREREEERKGEIYVR
jgi:hypothetical protein